MRFPFTLLLAVLALLAAAVPMVGAQGQCSLAVTSTECAVSNANTFTSLAPPFTNKNMARGGGGMGWGGPD